MDRNYLKGRDGDRANAFLAAAGYNFGLLLRWVEALTRSWTIDHPADTISWKLASDSSRPGWRRPSGLPVGAPRGAERILA